MSKYRVDITIREAER